MTWGFSREFRFLFQAPLAVEKPVAVLGRALWLYLVLALHANDRGNLLRARQRLAEDLAVSEAEIETWLERLVAAKLVDLRSSSKTYLVISLRSWPRSGIVASDLESTAAASDSSAAAAVTADAAVAEKENKQSSVRSREGGAGEGNSLSAELRAVLGEADAAELESFISDFPEAIVRRALERVRATPSRQIRKSRTALFRYLLKNSSDATP